MLRWIAFCWLFAACKVRGTIDVNLSELEYLAARLKPFECRRLIAALHYTSYELPKNVAEAERRVDEGIPCLQQLLHWNSSPAEGRGKTHEAIVHRLRQMGRNDLADWLGKTTFRQLGKDLERAMDEPFKELAGESTTDTSLGSVVPPDVPVDEDPWADVNTVLLAIVLGLLGSLITLICISIMCRIKEHSRARRDKNRLKADEGESGDRELMIYKKTRGKCSIRCTAQANALKADNETDTDID